MKYIKVQGPVAIVSVEGIYGINTVREIEEEFTKAQENGCVELIYDFSATSAIESVGLASIIKMNKKMKGKPQVKNPNALILRLFKTSDMMSDFNFVD